MSKEIFKKISPDIRYNEDMSRHTSFRIGGAADMYVSIKSAEELGNLINAAHAAAQPITVMGNGTNMLVSDKGIKGLVINIGKDFSEIKTDGNRVTAQAGVLLSKLAKTAAASGLSGLEAMSGIPGTLGGAVCMNAGAYGSEIKDVLKTVTYADKNGDFHTVTADECELGYRKSIFSGGEKYVLSAELELTPSDTETINATMAEYNKRRSDKQPLNLPSAGSVFKRPEGHFAGGLIEEAGLKGYRIGGAEVSEKHAGFIVNRGNATAEDVLRLIEYIQKTVWDKFGVELEPELKLIGSRR